LSEKRKTWKDRDCGHGKPEYRMTLDIVMCSEPNCYDEKLAKMGLRRMTKDEIAARAAIRDRAEAESK